MWISLMKNTSQRKNAPRTSTRTIQIARMSPRLNPVSAPVDLAQSHRQAMKALAAGWTTVHRRVRGRVVLAGPVDTRTTRLRPSRVPIGLLHEAAPATRRTASA